MMITSRQLIDSSQAGLPHFEINTGVQVHRVGTSSFGRDALRWWWLDYLTFHWRAMAQRRQLAKPNYIVVAKTDPPLLGVSVAPVAASVRCK